MGHTHSCRVDGADLKAGWIQRAHLLLEFIGGRERVVTQIHVVLQRELDLAVCEESSGDVLVVEPLEDRLEGVKPTIEGEHEFRSWRFCLCGGHGWLSCVCVCVCVCVRVRRVSTLSGMRNETKWCD